MGKQIYLIISIFFVTQLLGLFTGITLVREAVSSPELQELNIAPGGESASPYSSFIFLLYVMLGAMAILLIIKFYKGVILFKLLESMTLLIASGVIFFVILYSFRIPHALPISAFLSLSLTTAKFFRPGLKNVAAVLASAGVGAVLGFSLDIVPTTIFVIGLSIYDFLAVFWTGHMITMAKALSRKQLAFSVAATETYYDESTGKEERSTLELGTGDLTVPLMVSVSAYKISFSIVDSLFVLLGAFIGLLFVLYYVTRKRAFLPALPPITFAALIFLAVSRTLAAFI